MMKIRKRLLRIGLYHHRSFRSICSGVYLCYAISRNRCHWFFRVVFKLAQGWISGNLLLFYLFCCKAQCNVRVSYTVLPEIDLREILTFSIIVRTDLTLFQYNMRYLASTDLENQFNLHAHQFSRSETASDRKKMVIYGSNFNMQSKLNNKRKFLLNFSTEPASCHIYAAVAPRVDFFESAIRRLVKDLLNTYMQQKF